MRFQISMQDELYDELSNFAKENYLSKSGLIAVSVNDYLKQKKLIDVMAKFEATLRLLMSKENLSELDLAELNEISVALHMLTKS